MSVVTTRQVYCDGCGEPLEGTVASGYETVAEARRASRLAGWVRRRGADGKCLDLCELCKGEAKAKGRPDGE